MGPAKFTLADAFVFTACELTAVPLCHAGWEAVVSDEHIFRGIVALVVGIPLGIFGLSFHWLKEQLGGSSLEWIQRQGSRWWPAAILLAFIYAAGPSIYQRTVTSIQSEQSTGRIVWNFEQTARGGGYFLPCKRWETKRFASSALGRMARIFQVIQYLNLEPLAKRLVLSGLGALLGPAGRP
jgi:hypothetical protein